MDAQQEQSAKEAQKRWEAQARVKHLSENRPTKAQAQMRRLNALVKDALDSGCGVGDPKVKSLMGLYQRVRSTGALPSARMRALVYSK